MDSRDRILQAAARVYAESGFRGATTRRIAAEAGVNEVTLFRIFGSKSALMDEILQARARHIPVADLPETPADPLRELTAWCAGYLDHLHASRALISKMMSEVEERPTIAPCAGTGPTCAAQALRGYLERLRGAGMAPAAGDTTAAIAMLLGTLFADAMGRDVWPNVFPQPLEGAARQYARLFLRAIGAGARGAGGRADEKAAGTPSKVRAFVPSEVLSNSGQAVRPRKEQQTTSSRKSRPTAAQRRASGRP